MDKNYIKALNIVEDALTRINSIYENAAIKTFEDIKGCKATEKLMEDLEDFISTIKHYSRDAKEGYLKLQPNGKYELNGQELSCGSPMEVYKLEYKEWEDGRVEHSSKYGGYYFYSYDGEHYSLADGIKARVRI